MSNFDAGNQLLQEDKLEEAIVSYCDAIKLNPTNSWFHHHLGEALGKMERFDEAVTAYRHAIELNPDFCWSYHHLGDTLTQQQQWEESATAFRQAIELNPEHYGTYVGLGNSLAKLGQLDDAIAAYRRAKELNPDADWINFALAEVLEQKKPSDLALAIASCQRAIELNPDDLQAYHKFLEIQPENCNVWFQLAETLAKQNHLEEAIAAYRQAIEMIDSEKQTTSNLNPQDERELMIAHYQQAIKDNPDSISDHYKFLELQPDNQEVLLQLAKALVRQEQIEEAIATYRRLVEVSPREEYYHQLGELLVKQEKWDDAISIYRYLVNLNRRSSRG